MVVIRRGLLGGGALPARGCDKVLLVGASRRLGRIGRAARAEQGVNGDGMVLVRREERGRRRDDGITRMVREQPVIRGGPRLRHGGVRAVVKRGMWKEWWASGVRARGEGRGGGGGGEGRGGKSRGGKRRQGKAEKQSGRDLGMQQASKQQTEWRELRGAVQLVM